MADKKLTAEEFEKWHPVVAILTAVQKHIINRNAAINAIGPYLRSGLIRTGARRYSYRGEVHAVTEIASSDWGTPDHINLTDLYDFWRTGTLVVRRQGSPLTYFDVRFDPNGVAEMMAAIAPSEPTHWRPPLETYAGGTTWVSEEYDEKIRGSQSVPSPPAAKHPGGRPPYDWDAIWAAIGIRLMEGWKPRQQKDIEAEMKKQAENLGFDPVPGRTATQERASKLASALGLKD
ncbi:MAG: hypothetical protein JNL61_04785 [Rhizobiaceae bacterium]|nr:hypothetical protein [Rhizobiaceae bacterium]